MAKFAVIFFLFALFAVAMSARIAREEPTVSPVEDAFNKAKEGFEKIAQNLKDLADSPQMKELTSKIGEAAADALEKVKAGVAQGSADFQKVTLPPAH
ncbi:neuropeptide-like 2 [Drosophila gunungcola]|uniref:neuropeptide-like 2 n=1 Tax=Drosophila gunungcola TaxID=103775 RepID=UPI0022E84E6E|nr:neuropeptide-like 2 [Drosophila gunungcola]